MSCFRSAILSYSLARVYPCCCRLTSRPPPLVAAQAPFPGRSPSKRGVGLSFGPDITKAFLELNNLEMLVRSHEVKEEGYLLEHDGKCCTVFSAPNYCDQMGNKARRRPRVATRVSPPACRAAPPQRALTRARSRAHARAALAPAIPPSAWPLRRSAGYVRRRALCAVPRPPRRLPDARRALRPLLSVRGRSSISTRR